MKVYVTLKAWEKSNCRNVLWLDNDRRCRLFSVHPTISEVEDQLSTVYTSYKNNLCKNSYNWKCKSHGKV